MAATFKNFIDLQFFDGISIVADEPYTGNDRLTAKKIATLCAEKGANAVWVTYTRTRRNGATGCSVTQNYKWSIVDGSAVKVDYFSRAR